MNHRVLSVLAVVIFVSAQAAAGGFSKLPVSARAVTLGGSLVSFSDDPNVIFYNPAGIASLKTLSLSTSYTQLFTGISDDRLSYISGSAVANLGLVGNLGVGIRSFSSNYWKENEIVGSYAQGLFDLFFVGGSVKMLQWSAPAPSGRLAVPEDGYSNVTFSFDAGAQAQLKNIIPDNDIRFGIFLGDINQPSIAKNGAAEGKLNLKLSTGVAYISRVYNYAVTAHYTVAGTMKRLGLGMEILALQTSIFEQPVALMLRAGGGGGLQASAKQGDLNGGLGFTVAGLTFDYAFAYQTELLYISGTHHLTLRYSF
ncbi:MAG: hypothetical protein AABZ02_03460 [Bacteroidota bacterium]